jgi:hypothetical protein
VIARATLRLQCGEGGIAPGQTVTRQHADFDLDHVEPVAGFGTQWDSSLRHVTAIGSSDSCFKYAYSNHVGTLIEEAIAPFA